MKSCRCLTPLFLLVLFSLASCRRSPTPSASASDSEGKVRPPGFAGTWYPGDPKDLRDFVEKQLATADLPRLRGPVVGLIAPHAGYVFTGPVLGAAYRSVQGEDIREVVLLGSPHRVPVRGAAVPEADAFRTPLGTVRVNTRLRKALLARCKFAEKTDAPHEPEHSLELQLPFLQVALKEFRILPVLVGDLSASDSEALARALADLLGGKRALIVASTDLSHYPSYEDAQVTDEAILGAAKSLDPEKLADKDKELRGRRVSHLDCTMCGLNAVLVLERAARWMGVKEAKLLLYRNSGDVPEGNKSGVVGYGAVAFLASKESGGKWGKPSPEAEEAVESSSSEKAAPATVSAEGQKRLLDIARRSIEAAVRNERAPDLKVEEPELTRKAGAFVTLKKRGDLRGCIGLIEPVAALWKTVAYAAGQAATRDPRFEPVSPAELPELHVEISVLSPVVPVKDLKEIEVGRDGLIVEQGRAKGLLLPQVATEQGWDQHTFLAQTCRKAGLPLDAYKKGASVFKFTAQVFGEEER